MLAALALAWIALAEPPLIPAPPEPLDLALTWRAPSSCGSARDVENRIAALLPWAPTGDGQLQIDAAIEEIDGGFDLELISSFRGVTEERELRAPRCEELIEATALLVAVALEPRHRAELLSSAAPEVAARVTSTEERMAPAAVEGPRAQPLPPLKLPVARELPDRSDPIVPSGAPQPPRMRPPALLLRLAAGLEIGALPPPSGALAAAIVVRWPRARFELHGAYLTPRSHLDDQGKGARYQLGAAGLRGCGLLRARTLEFPLCFGGEAGALRARPRGLPTPVQHAPWVAAVGSAAIARAWTRAAVWAGVDVLGRIVGTRFAVGTNTSLAQFPAEVRILLGVELRLTRADKDHGRAR